MDNLARLQARARDAVEVQILERDIREGHKYREAKRRLDEALERGDHPAAIAMLRFAVAVYSPPDTKS